MYNILWFLCVLFFKNLCRVLKALHGQSPILLLFIFKHTISPVLYQLVIISASKPTPTLPSSAHHPVPTPTIPNRCNLFYDNWIHKWGDYSIVPLGCHCAPIRRWQPYKAAIMFYSIQRFLNVQCNIFNDAVKEKYLYSAGNYETNKCNITSVSTREFFQLDLHW